MKIYTRKGDTGDTGPPWWSESREGQPTDRVSGFRGRGGGCPAWKACCQAITSSTDGAVCELTIRLLQRECATRAGPRLQTHKVCRARLTDGAPSVMADNNARCRRRLRRRTSMPPSSSPRRAGRRAGPGALRRDAIDGPWPWSGRRSPRLRGCPVPQPPRRSAVRDGACGRWGLPPRRPQPQAFKPTRGSVAGEASDAAIAGREKLIPIRASPHSGHGAGDYRPRCGSHSTTSTSGICPGTSA